MDPNRLTQKTQEALHDAQTKALRYGHTEVDIEHLLLALLEQPDGLVPRAARADAASTSAALRGGGRARLGGRPRVSGPGARRARSTSRARSTRCSTRPSRRPSA